MDLKNGLASDIFFNSFKQFKQAAFKMKCSYLFFILFLTMTHLSVHASQGLNLKKIQQTPDLVQTSRAAGFYKSGSHYCAPVAVSNSLVWLSLNKRIPVSLENPQDQYDLVKKLASNNYLRTDKHNGTGPNSLTKGLDKYLSSIGLKNYTINHSGWRICRDKYNSGQPLDIDWIKENISGSAVQWLNIGWYRLKKGKMHRFGGHWLTVVEYHRNRCYALDPAPRNGIEKKTHLLTLEPSPEYKLTGKTKGLPKTSKGMFQIVKGFNFKNGTDLCLIDSAVSLQIN